MEERSAQDIGWLLYKTWEWSLLLLFTSDLGMTPVLWIAVASTRSCQWNQDAHKLSLSLRCISIIKLNIHPVLVKRTSTINGCRNGRKEVMAENRPVLEKRFWYAYLTIRGRGKSVNILLWNNNNNNESYIVEKYMTWPRTIDLQWHRELNMILCTWKCTIV